MKAGPSLLLLCAATAFAAPKVCSQGRLQQLLDTSIKHLDEPDHRLNALRTLENLGKLAVPEIKKRLHWQKRHDLSRQQQVDLLYVVGQMGKTGVMVMPELLSWLHERDREAVTQLMLTFAELAPHLEQEPLAELGAAVRSSRAGMPRTVLVGLVMAQARLGAAPTTERLLASLKDYSHEAAAACRKICANPSRDPAVIERIQAALTLRLEKLTKRTFLSMNRGSSSVSAELADAWQVISKQPLNNLVARALLTHRLPAERLRAVLWLDEHARDLPAEERCDLVVRLWDGDSEVAAAAAKALGHWQANGALALPALHQMATSHRAKAVQTAAATAATAIAEAFRTRNERDVPWLRGCDKILQDAPAPIPDAPPTDAGKRAMAELLMMAQWQTPARLRKLLAYTTRTEPSIDAARAVYGWLASKDAPIVDAALSWMATNRKVTVDAMQGIGNRNLTARCNTLAVYQVPRPCRGAAFETTAWLLTANSTSGDLRDMLEDANTRLVARALAELLTRSNERLLEVVPRLRTLTAMHAKEKLALQLSPFTEIDRFDYHLSEPVRVLAALALAHAGVIATDNEGLADPGLERLIQKHCGCSLEQLPTEFAERKKANTLGDLIYSLENQCRRALYAPMDLPWPRAGQK